MCDVLTGISIAAESLSICVKAISLLKKVYTAARDARRDLNNLVQLLGRTRNLLELIKLALLKLRRLGEAGVIAVFVGSSDRMKGTLQQVHDQASKIVGSQAHLGIARRLMWAVEKPRVQELIRLVEEEERHLSCEFNLISMYTSLRTQSDIESLKEDSARRSELTPAFPDHAASDGDKDTLVAADEHSALTRTWLGHVLTESHTKEYLQLRDRLAEAAYYGDWEQMFATIEQGLHQYGENWVNAPRMKDRAHYTRLTMWLPLHQAVYQHAPVDVVQRLVDLGASRTLRTKTSEFSFANMSPLEMAHQLELFHLYDILRPVVKQPLPLQTLVALERNFHSLIGYELGSRVHADKMYLPVLEVLTELGGDTVWFPVKIGHSPAGYLYQLYGRELQVKSVNIRQPYEEVLYLITEDDIVETDEIFNFAGDLPRGGDGMERERAQRVNEQRGNEQRGNEQQSDE